MTQEDVRRSLLKDITIELDAITMDMLKFILDSKPELSDLENYFAHNLNIILENNRVVLYSLDSNFTTSAGTCIRNLVENWANLNYILRDPSKKELYATKITQNAFIYAQTMERIILGQGSVEELYTLPSWTTSTITQRVESIGDGQVFQYAVLSRYTHMDMWAAINDIIIKKSVFWSNLLGWGIEAANHTLHLISQEVALPHDLTTRYEQVNDKVQAHIVSAESES